MPNSPKGGRCPFHLDLADFVDRLGLKKIILVAWSWGCLDAYAYVRARGTENLKAFICIGQTPKPLSAPTDEWAGLFTLSDAGEAEMHGAAEALGANPYAFFSGFFPGLNARKVTEAETEWFTRQAMLTPTNVALLLFFDANFSTYTPEAKQLDASDAPASLSTKIPSSLPVSNPRTFSMPSSLALPALGK